jgi:putative endonuclease
MYYVYILYSLNANKSYVGSTDNPERRLSEHNSGRSYFTDRYKPWVLIYLEEYRDKISALRREKYLKSRSGRRWIKKEVFVD